MANCRRLSPIVGFARRPKTDEEFRKEQEEATRKFSRQTVRDEIWNGFAEALFYHQSEFHDANGYKSLAERLDKIDQERGTGGNRLFYLAVAPDQFEPILKNLKEAGLNKPREGGWARVIVEKPFGTDLATAQELNAGRANGLRRKPHLPHRSLPRERDRAEHHGAAVRERDLRAALESRYIDHVQITAAETLGVEGRAGYYEAAGALRDMVQNHLLQLLCLVAMEPPTDLGADSIRDEKVKIVRSLRRMTRRRSGANVVRGQYAEGAINGKAVPAYRSEENVKPESHDRDLRRAEGARGQLALADVPDLHPRRQTAPEVGHGNLRPFQEGAGGPVQPASRFRSIRTCS